MTPSRLLAPEFPLRLALADEVHARPSDVIATPARATHVAMLVATSEREREHEHLAVLCRHFGQSPPPPGTSQFSIEADGLRMRWERHGEFSGLTFSEAGVSAVPFSEPAVRRLPEGWLAALPGQTLVAAHAKLVARAGEGVTPEFLARHFDGNVVAGSGVGGGAGAAYTDFRIHADGFSRFLLVDDGFTPRQAGRMMQRLFEIEAYRMMALLTLPVARQQSAQLAEIELALAGVTTEIASGSGDDEALLTKVTHLAAQVESRLAGTQFRFAACRAYSALVATRIEELREHRLPGVQPIGEFMDRRFTPAVATCATVSDRLHGLSERVARAGALLSTRVDIVTERQNQSLLASMDGRARLQFRLQQTVEGLSLAAIVYYAAGLVAYVAKGIKRAGAGLDVDLVVALSVPVLALLVVLAMRRFRRRAHEP
jgi:uncharacterized membrane-anchored protein